MELGTKEEKADALKRLEDFLAVGSSLQLDSLKFNKGADLKTLVLMITTDTSALLQQVMDILFTPLTPLLPGRSLLLLTSENHFFR